MKPEIRKPNFFIVGAPKCGTTTLYKYLSIHPNVFVPDPKEPHFFAPDIYTFIRSPRIYYDLFSDSTPHHYAIGEASTSYLASERAARDIVRWNDRALFIAIIRNPVDQFASLHSECCRLGFEREHVAELAWKKYEQTSQDVLHSYRGTAKVFTDYGLFCKTGSQLKRLLEIAGANKTKILLYDLLFSQPTEVISDICSFLDVPFCDIPIYRHNVRVYPRFKFLTNTIGSMYNWTTLRPMREILFTLTNRYRTGVLETMWPILFKKTTETSLTDTFKTYLSEYFEEEICRIEEITRLNLSCWRRPLYKSYV